MLRAVADGAASGPAGDPRIFAASVFTSAGVLTPFLLRFLCRHVALPEVDFIERLLIGGLSGIVFGFGVSLGTSILVPLLSSEASRGVLGGLGAAIIFAVFGGLVVWTRCIPIILVGGSVCGALEASLVRGVICAKRELAPSTARPSTSASSSTTS
jgi:hypothetical protein